jgi:5S rRNA maturation endonuclease (ribonuclease M5)
VAFQNKIGLIVEGESDKRTLEKVFSKIRINAEFRVIPGGFNVRKINVLARMLSNSGCKKVIVLKDTECKQKDEMYEELKDKIRELEEVEICFVQCSLESWLLADEKAIEYLIDEKTKRSVKVKNFSNPESIPKPKDEMREIFRKAGVRISYIETVHAPEIASRADINKWEEKCESFKEMMEKIRN